MKLFIRMFTFNNFILEDWKAFQTWKNVSLILTL